MVGTDPRYKEGAGRLARSRSQQPGSPSTRDGPAPDLSLSPFPPWEEVVTQGPRGNPGSQVTGGDRLLPAAVHPHPLPGTPGGPHALAVPGPPSVLHVHVSIQLQAPEKARACL